IFNVAGPASTWNGTLKQNNGVPNWTAHYDGVLGKSTLVRGIIGQDREKNLYTGDGANTAQLIDTTVTPNPSSGGVPAFTNLDAKRTIYKADLTQFVSAGGSHEIKAGADYENVLTQVAKMDGGGGQRIYRRRLSSGVVYYEHRYFVNDLAPGFVRGNTA